MARTPNPSRSDDKFAVHRFSSAESLRTYLIGMGYCKINGHGKEVVDYQRVGDLICVGERSIRDYCDGSTVMPAGLAKLLRIEIQREQSEAL